MKKHRVFGLHTTASLFLATILFCMMTGAFASDHSSHSKYRQGLRSIVGSWEIIDDNFGNTFFGTYNGGLFTGTVNFTSPNNFTSLTHGVWKRMGARTFADTDTGFIYDENGIAVQKIEFRAEIEVSADGDSAFFDFAFEIRDLDGTFVDSGESTATGRRIVVKPLSTD